MDARRGYPGPALDSARHPPCLRLPSPRAPAAQPARPGLCDPVSNAWIACAAGRPPASARGGQRRATTSRARWHPNVAPPTTASPPSSADLSGSLFNAALDEEMERVSRFFKQRELDLQVPPCPRNPRRGATGPSAASRTASLLPPRGLGDGRPPISPAAAPGPRALRTTPPGPARR